MTKKILIIGASGSFGERLRKHLVNFDGIELWLSSRSAKSVQKMVEETQAKLQALGKPTNVHGVVFDHQNDLETQLEKIKPWAVLDLSGPYQMADYHICEAAIKVGAHVIDLADALGYINGYQEALERPAKQQGLMAIAGASSTPALSLSVLDSLIHDWQRVDDVEIAIAPAGKSQVGRSVVEGVLTYAERRVMVWQGGKASTKRGWEFSNYVTLPRIGKRRTSYVETIDALHIGEKYKVTNNVSFSAGLDSSLEHRGMEFFSFLHDFMKRKFNVDLKYSGLISAMMLGRKFTRPFNSDLGGMVIIANGLDANGKSATRQWSLVAGSDHGPSIPIMAMAAALRKMIKDDAQNKITPRACLANEFLSCDEILAEMKDYDITWQVDEKRL